jgi:hypothetical protein
MHCACLCCLLLLSGARAAKCQLHICCIVVFCSSALAYILEVMVSVLIPVLQHICCGCPHPCRPPHSLTMQDTCDSYQD